MNPNELRRIRAERGLTQDELAILAGVNVRTVIRLEQGRNVRADTVKAICAALDLPFTPPDGIEVIAPDRLRDDPSTGRFLEAAASLPGVRYLVRPDARATAEHLRRLLAARDFRGAWALLGYGDLAWHLTFASIFVAATAAAYLQHPSDFESLDSCIRAHGVVGTAVIGFSVWMESSLIVFLLIYWFIRTRDIATGGIERVGQCIAVGGESLWLMTVDGGEVTARRIYLGDGRVVVSRILEERAIYRITGWHTYHESLPAHPGLMDLIGRPRPGDVTRRISLATPAGG